MNLKKESFLIFETGGTIFFLKLVIDMLDCKREITHKKKVKRMNFFNFLYKIVKGMIRS